MAYATIVSYDPDAPSVLAVTVHSTLEEARSDLAETAGEWSGAAGDAEPSDPDRYDGSDGTWIAVVPVTA